MAAHLSSLTKFDPSLGIKGKSFLSAVLPYHPFSDNPIKEQLPHGWVMDSTFLTSDLLVCHVSCWKLRCPIIRPIPLPNPPIPMPFVDIQVIQEHFTPTIYHVLLAMQEVSFFLSFIACLVGIVFRAVNRAVQFNTVLLAFKSTIFYHPNPGTKGFVTDPLLVQFFEAAFSWARFS